MIEAPRTHTIFKGFTPLLDPDTIQAKFEAFHRQNPHVYDELVKLCLDVKARGRKRWSMKGAFEVLRWSTLHTRGNDDFKLNNNYTSIYARLISRTVPELEDFFQIREITTI